jgi:hypothetical protein
LVWRPILERIATLTEIEKYWTLTDLLDAHEALDERYEAEKKLNRK